MAVLWCQMPHAAELAKRARLTQAATLIQRWWRRLQFRRLSGGSSGFSPALHFETEQAAALELAARLGR